MQIIKFFFSIKLTIHIYFTPVTYFPLHSKLFRSLLKVGILKINFPILNHHYFFPFHIFNNPDGCFNTKPCKACQLLSGKWYFKRKWSLVFFLGFKIIQYTHYPL